MKVEDQVCTLEQAKQLKELGINGKCVFGYIEIPANGISCPYYWRHETYALINADIVMFCGNGEKQRWYAPSSAELGVMLPSVLELPRQNAYSRSGDHGLELQSGEIIRQYDLVVRKVLIKGVNNQSNDVWMCTYVRRTALIIRNNIVPFSSTREAQAKAALLIHLLENNYITAEEVNKRLQATEPGPAEIPTTH